MTMGQRIAEERKKLNLSQEGLGERMGVSRQAISKWESDGAVPDIDKLIALSKLFGVTVGWLLGVEEEPKPGGEQEIFSEAQLKTVEEIVKRYQPAPAQPEKPKRKWLKIAAAVVAAVVLWNVFDQFSQRMDRTEVMINGINSTYSTIQYQIGLLADRLNELAKGEKLLSDYSVTGESWSDLKGAVLTFTMTPKAHGAEETAYVAVRYDGEEVAREECAWDGTCWKGDVSLSARDGYEYYFIQCGADGAQQQELMEYTGCADVKSLLEGTCYVTCKELQITKGDLIFNGFNIDYKPPKFALTEAPAIENIEWVIRVDGAEYYRDPIESGGTWEEATSIAIGGTGQYRYVLTPDASDVVLSLEVTLSSGSKTVDVAHWVYENGEWAQEIYAYPE